MNQGSIIANICYEYFDASEKKYRNIGALTYYRNHSGGMPDAQLRLDIIPALAWANNPRVYFIGNFIPSEKIPDPVYVCGDIFIASDVRGQRTKVGHIGTRQKQGNDQTQYYLQLFGIPLREISKATKRMAINEIKSVLEKANSIEEAKSFVKEIEGNRKMSIYLNIDMDS